MDDVVNRFARELADSIAAAVSESAEVEACRERARAAGYEMKVNASNLPPQFDPTKFPVPGGITVPLATFAEGEYRLAVKISDKAANKTLNRDIKFTVKGS